MSLFLQKIGITKYNFSAWKVIGGQNPILVQPKLIERGCGCSEREKRMNEWWSYWVG